MNVKEMVLASISYVLITMAIAYPWHMVWFHDLYEGMGAYTRPEPGIHLGMLSMLMQGVVIVYLYPIFFRGGNPIFKELNSVLLSGLVKCLRGGANGVGIPDLIITQNAKQNSCKVYSLDKHFRLLNKALKVKVYV